MHNLSKNVAIRRLTVTAGGAYQVTAGTDGDYVASGVVDTDGYDGVMFLAFKGTGVNANVVLFKAQQSSDNGVVDAFADIAGTLQTITDVGGNMASKMIGCDIYKPAERYVRAAIQRTTQNSAIDGLIAILYRGHHRPVTQLLTAGQFAAAPEVFNNVDAGTA